MLLDAKRSLDRYALESLEAHRQGRIVPLLKFSKLSVLRFVEWVLHQVDQERRVVFVVVAMTPMGC
jgi:hypothetical protein